MTVHRIIVAPSKKKPEIYKIFNLEIERESADLSCLNPVLADPVLEKVVAKMPPKTSQRQFKEVIYSNAVIDPEQENIIKICAHKGIDVAAAKVSYRYYGKKIRGIYVNKLVHDVYTDEPVLTTLRPRGVRNPMEYFDLTEYSNKELLKLSEEKSLSLSLSKMKKLVEFQKRLDIKAVTDVFLETFAGAWSQHCFHDLWKSLGLFEMLKKATEKIGNPNLISAFVDNAGVWDFYEGLCILFKLETHNSPSQKEPYGGQLTKLGGVLRDIFENGLGAKPIGNIEMTVVGEFERKRYPEFAGAAMPASIIGRETIRAIADYGNPMGIPMMTARMLSHPNYSGKPFALGGAVGITTKEAAKKGMPRTGDIAVMVGGRTGNDGLHGATISSGGITEFTDTGDSTHVQIGLPYIEQLMMRAGLELRDNGCCSARNDFGALGIVSAFGEMGQNTDGVGGFICNLALVKLKCAGLANWQIAVSESQERFAHAIKPEKYEEAMAIYRKYGLEATPIGIFSGNGRFQMFYDPDQAFSQNMHLSGEICLDVPYSFFDECPLDQIEVKEPEPRKDTTPVHIPVSWKNAQEMGSKVVGHFDICDQSKAITQYDSTVQGITWQGPLYGRNHNIASPLAVLKPTYRKQHGLTVSLSFSPWQFEVDPVQAAKNAMMDVLVTQTVTGVKPADIALADNFYTDGDDPEARWYLKEQVKAISDLSVQTGTPFMVGKDSSAGRGTYNGVIVCVLPAVCITAMGKTPNVSKLVLHQWQNPGNVLCAVGPRTTRLDGSLLASALDIQGKCLDEMVMPDPKSYLEWLYYLAHSGMIASATPINQGGIFRRLFEGVEASGFGIATEICRELFPESFGAALLEVREDAIGKFMHECRHLDPMIIGTIRPKKGITVQGKRLNYGKLKGAWQKTFKEALWGKIAEQAQKEVAA